MRQRFRGFLIGFFALGVLAFTIQSCSKDSTAPTEPTSPAATTGTLHLYMASDWGGCVQDFLAKVDGVQVGGPFQPGGSMDLTLTPGLHTVQFGYRCLNSPSAFCGLQPDGVSINAGSTTNWGFSKGGTDCANFCHATCPAGSF